MIATYRTYYTSNLIKMDGMPVLHTSKEHLDKLAKYWHPGEAHIITLVRLEPVVYQTHTERPQP